MQNPVVEVAIGQQNQFSIADERQGIEFEIAAVGNSQLADEIARSGLEYQGVRRFIQGNGKGERRIGGLLPLDFIGNLIDDGILALENQ